MKVIIINGFGNVGKDFFISKVQEKIENIYNISTIDPIKESCKVLGIEINKNNTKDREMLHLYKKWWVENFNGSFNYIVGKVEEIREENQDAIIFLHSREISEITMFKSLFDAKTLLIKEVNKESNECDQLKNQIKDYDYDIIIENDFNNLTGLDKEVERFVALL